MSNETNLDPHSTEFKTVGTSGQISLGKSYAGKTLRLERFPGGRIVLTTVAMIPESQLWTLAEPHRSRIEHALAWAAENPAHETDLATIEGHVQEKRLKEKRTKRAGHSRVGRS
jgi:hypothetical protein